MEFQFKTDFDELAQEPVMEGARQKLSSHGGVRFRLVEYSKTMPTQWCEKGHCGCVVQGRLEIKHAGGKVTCKPGDGKTRKVDGLLKAYESLGLRDVTSYIRSGNVLLNSANTNTGRMREELQNRIRPRHCICERRSSAR